MKGPWTITLSLEALDYLRALVDCEDDFDSESQHLPHLADIRAEVREHLDAVQDEIDKHQADAGSYHEPR